MYVKTCEQLTGKRCFIQISIKAFCLQRSFYDVLAMKYNQGQYSPKEGRLPVYIADIPDICDPVLTFDQIMEKIGIEQYLKKEM